MAPAKSQTLWLRILKFGFTLGFTPVYWDSSAAILKVSQSRVRLAWTKIQLVFVVLYELFLVYQAIKPLNFGGSKSRTQVRYLGVLWIFMNCDHVGNIWIPEYVVLMNELNAYTRRDKNAQAKKGESQMFTKVLAFIGTFTTLTVTIKAMAGSSSLTLLTSLMVAEGEKMQGLWFLWSLPIACFHFITNGFHMFAYWLQWTSIVAFSRDLSHDLHMVKPHKRGQHFENSVMSKKFTRKYRALGVLQRQFGSLYEHYMWQIQAAAIFAVVLNTYQAVVGANARALVLACGVALGFIQFLEATAKVYHTSSDVLGEWRRISRDDVPLGFPTFLRSCKFLSVPVGSFFDVDRGLILTCLTIMLNTSASLIITH